MKFNVCGFTPPHGDAVQSYFDVMKRSMKDFFFSFFFFTSEPHSSHKCIEAIFFDKHSHSPDNVQHFAKSQQTRDSVFALLRLIAGVAESPRDPSWGPLNM